MTKHHDPKPNPTEEHTAQSAEEKAIEHPAYEELLAKLNEAEEKANRSTDQALRTQAELENIRRRAEKDVSNAHKYGLEKLINEILPVIDGIERGLAIPAPNAEAKNIHAGMEMTLGMLLKALEKYGVKQINPVGEVFNPEQHQALSMVEKAGAAPNTVIEVMQQGYLLNDRLLRPAMVIVAK